MLDILLILYLESLLKDWPHMQIYDSDSQRIILIHFYMCIR